MAPAQPPEHMRSHPQLAAAKRAGCHPTRPDSPLLHPSTDVAAVSHSPLTNGSSPRQVPRPDSPSPLARSRDPIPPPMAPHPATPRHSTAAGVAPTSPVSAGLPRGVVSSPLPLHSTPHDEPPPGRPDSPLPQLRHHHAQSLHHNVVAAEHNAAAPLLHNQPAVLNQHPNAPLPHNNFANEPFVQSHIRNDDMFNPPDPDDRLMDIASLDAIYSVQKMAEVLVVGPDSEREFILFELQQLLDHCLEDTMKILIPVLCEHVPKWNTDLQIKSAQRLYDVVCLDLDPPTANMITCAAFGVIHRAKGRASPEYEELYNLWGGLLVDCLPNMQWTPQEVKDVIALVDIHSKEPLFTSRKVAARVIGALAQCLDRAKVEKIILPRALQLFEDTDVEVRGTVVESLAMVGAALPIRVTESEVWPRVEGLLEPPEEARIRATAMRTMAHILEAHRETSGPCRLFRELLPPVFARLAVFARKFSAEDQRLVHDDTYLLLEVASEVFGQFAYTLSLFTKKSFRKEAYKAYAGMASCNGPIIRRNCAFNLPGVAKALGERYALELSGLCDFFAKDMDEEVRWILAAGIHETTALLAPRGNFERLFGAVCALLQDENPMVRMNALAHFHDLLSSFVKDGSDPASLKRLAPVFSDLTMLSEGEWRIQKSLAEQLGKCAELIPPDALMDNVLPLLYRLTEQGTPLVREAAMDATIRALRNIPFVKDRNVAIEKYWKAASKGPFWMRLALLDGGMSAMKVFSHKRFAELFASQMLHLASDPVANVRIRVASLLAPMAPMCLNSPVYIKALEALRNTDDVDVAAYMQVHNEAVSLSLQRAGELHSEDVQKYRDEQEFYGLANRTQKRARGRGVTSKANHRLMMHMRRPSTEQSSGQLSVSKAVINAAKASSAAASAMKGGYHHPRLPETDSAVYLGPCMEEVTSPANDLGAVDADSESVTDSVANTAETPNGAIGGVVPTVAHNVLDSGVPQLIGTDGEVVSVMSVAGAGSGGGLPSSRSQSGRGGDSDMNQNVAVVQQTMGRQARYEARSKSWNGIMAQLPRQLSMEGRSKKQQQLSGGGANHGISIGAASGRVVGGTGDASASEIAVAATGGKAGEAGSGWSKQGREAKRNLSSLRRKKKRAAESRPVSEDFASSGVGVGATTNSRSHASQEVGATGARVVAARAKSMVAHTAGNEAVKSSVASRVRTSLDDRGGAGGGGVATSNVPVVYEDNGLPSFKGYAPWLRSKRTDENLEQLSDAAHRKVFGVPDVQYGRAATASLADGTSNSTSQDGDATTTTGSTGGGSGGGGFFRGLFRRRR